MNSNRFHQADWIRQERALHSSDGSRNRSTAKPDRRLYRRPATLSWPLVGIWSVASSLISAVCSGVLSSTSAAPCSRASQSANVQRRLKPGLRGPNPGILRSVRLISSRATTGRSIPIIAAWWRIVDLWRLIRPRYWDRFRGLLVGPRCRRIGRPRRGAGRLGRAGLLSAGRRA